VSRFCLLAALVLLTACTAPPPVISTPTPEPPVRVTTTLSAQPFLGEITDRSLTGPTPFIITLAPTQPDLLLAAQTEDIIGLSLYLPEGTGLWATPLGNEPIAVIINANASVAGFSLNQLADIYAGRDSAWAAAVREEGDDSRLFFDTVALRGLRPAATIRVAPSPEAMIDYVSDTSNGLGYIPQRWLKDVSGVTVVEIEGALPGNADYPLTALLVAFANQEPSGPARDWLGNVQMAGTK
jgi:DNA-binding transcriptional LysR family regulator